MGEVTFSGPSIVVVTGLLGALAATIGMLFRLLMATKDASLKDMTSQRDSYQKVAAQSIAALELAANRARRARGESPFVPIPPVVAEHNSPTTPAQKATAEFQTLLARAARANRLLELPPMEELPAEVTATGYVEEDETPSVLVVAESVDVQLKVGETVTISAVPVEKTDDES